ncbi:hypothetical protein [Actinomarinicola tropica]|uniref:DUF2029 domain-containing protein n=1 Tax=Actinomarinicola tropica TaxID=2789776 RepID=A0A5Q2RNR4_9ACTN|nr:hypothetical protein [Actinomarinicola tropica]QGG96592.1 hypothetical protein GH723_16605 [Actinomarinicola tropica]
MPTTDLPPARFVGRLPGVLGADARPLLLGAAVLVLGYLPLVALGPGTDLDVGGVHDAGRAILRGDYSVSRTPGAPVHEAIVGVLHALGGVVLVNLASVVMAAVTALAVVRLLSREGHPHAGWYGLAVVLNPYVWIAGTSMVDFLWATGFALAGANAQLSRRWVPAAVLYALAAGCRLSTLFVIGAFVLADLLGTAPAERRRLVGLGAVTLALTAVVYLPPFVTMGWDFLDSNVPSSTLLVQVGRFGVKNWFFFGPVVIVLGLVVLPRLLRDLPRLWPSSAVLRMGLLGLVAAELVFLRFPWKLAHLLPAFLCLLLVLGAARLLGGRAIALLLVAQVLLGLVNVNLADPDRPDRATGGRFAPEVIEGQWVRDLRCRLDSDREAYRDPGRGDEGGDGVGADLFATWRCVVPWSE